MKAHHDTPTPGGLSPHQILFGRDPLSRGLPLSGDGMAMDAKEFFARQEATARDIRQQLGKGHAERQKSAPSSTAQKFRVGDPVWVIRPRPMGTHRTKTWFTPGQVVRRIGEDTYRIKVGHGQFRERHESQLRVREPDLRGQHVSLDYTAHEADSDDDYTEQDDYTVEKILAQRPNASAPGGLEFKVHWQGYGPFHDTWEPVSSFVPRINTPFMDYIRKHKTKLHVSDLAALTRAIAARGASSPPCALPCEHRWTFQSESTLQDIAKHVIAVCRSWIVHTPGVQFRLRCFRQTLSVSIFLLTFPWQLGRP